VKVVSHYLYHGLAPVKMGPAADDKAMVGAAVASLQFQAHVRGMEGVVGDPATAYDHWAWLSRQYATMGDLLQMYLPPPTLATKPQFVPSHYYHTAALHAVRRRKAAEVAGVLPHAHVPGSAAGDAPDGASAGTDGGDVARLGRLFPPTPPPAVTAFLASGCSPVGPPVLADEGAGVTAAVAAAAAVCQQWAQGLPAYLGE
jgi:hypothetical protein